MSTGPHGRPRRRSLRRLVVVLVVFVVVPNVLMRRRGYAIPGRTAVRCSRGHLFSAWWIEGVSFRALRLLPGTRFQRCPVGRHWGIVHPVRDRDLTDEERRAVGRPTVSAA